jgi:hypothetical protein
MRTERAMFKFHNFSLTAWLWLWIMFAAGSARAQQTSHLGTGARAVRAEQSDSAGKQAQCRRIKGTGDHRFLRPNPTFMLSADGT